MNLGKILEIENKYRLNELNIDGYHYWTLFRFSIIQTVHGVVDGTGKTHHIEPESFGQKVQSVSSRMINIINPNHYRISRSDYFFVSGGRRVLVDGKYENTICDILMDEYEDSIMLEYSLGGIHLSPAKTKHIVYHDRIGLAAGFCGKIHKLFNQRKYSEICQIIRQSLEHPIEEILEEYRVSVNLNGIMERMTDFYFSYHMFKKKYRKMLEMISPKVLIEVVSYDTPKMVLTEAAKELNIPVVELQHGTSGKEHPAYNYPIGAQISGFPDYYLAFSDFWRYQAAFPIPECNRIAVGSPFSERRALELKKNNQNNSEEKKIILFLSQPERGVSFSKIAVKLQEIIDTEKYRIVFKMHPTEHQGWKKRYPELAKSEVEAVDNTNSDLYELMSRSSFVVGIGNSTALFEALLFEAPVYVYYPESMEEYRNLVERGIVDRFDTVSELNDKICTYDSSNPSRTSFWEEDSLKKMVKAIEYISRR